jgi:hypothetical protein
MSVAFSDLVAEIKRGNCVAFIGAGFSAPAVPGWRGLLVRLTKELEGDAEADRLDANIGAMNDTDLAAVAQRLRDDHSDAFHGALERHASGATTNERMQERLRLVREIPFASILTTNFDGLLPGTLADAQRYREVLRGGAGTWTASRHWGAGATNAVKLHGAIADKRVVFSRREYREQLYSNPAYLTFLRSLFSTRTVLYLGFSFTDAYLNELRSEVLSLLGHRKGDAPIAYAIVADVKEHTRRFYAEHEGIALLDYPSNPDHVGFDERLRELHAQTSPRKRLGDLVSKRRIVWMDPNRENNAEGVELLRSVSDRCDIVEVRTVDEAIAAMREPGSKTDLVLSHWGYDPLRKPAAERLLREMRRQDLFAPVIVFASPLPENRSAATRLGALAYEHDWPALFASIERLFAA